MPAAKRYHVVTRLNDSHVLSDMFGLVRFVGVQRFDCCVNTASTETVRSLWTEMNVLKYA